MRSLSLAVPDTAYFRKVRSLTLGQTWELRVREKSLFRLFCHGLKTAVTFPGFQGFISAVSACNEQKNLPEDLDELTLPDPGILSVSAAKNKQPWIPVQTRRGCPLKCSYCSTPAIEGTIIRKAVT
jgi:hypothetical protein